MGFCDGHKDLKKGIKCKSEQNVRKYENLDLKFKVDLITLVKLSCFPRVSTKKPRINQMLDHHCVPFTDKTTLFYHLKCDHAVTSTQTLVYCDNHSVILFTNVPRHGFFKNRIIMAFFKPQFCRYLREESSSLRPCVYYLLSSFHPQRFVGDL